MAEAWNGTEGVADTGYSAGVQNLNIFYDVRETPLPGARCMDTRQRLTLIVCHRPAT